MQAAIPGLAADDPRVSHRLATVSEAAGWLAMPRSTLHGWVHGTEAAAGEDALGGRPIVLALPARRGEPAVPLLGLAEGLVLGAFRRSGVPLQRIRPALDRLDRELGVSHALASDRLATDGAEVLYDYGTRLGPGEMGDLVTIRSGQLVLAPVVRESLRRIRYGDDHWAEQVELPGYAVARVVVHPRVAGGRPVLQPSGIPVDDVLGRWNAGDSLAELAGHFGLETALLEDLIRAVTRRCAA
jgi:uncharacterized protein (DUF433 family)